jgi:hypothetical protein
MPNAGRDDTEALRNAYWRSRELESKGWWGVGAVSRRLQVNKHTIFYWIRMGYVTGYLDGGPGVGPLFHESGVEHLARVINADHPPVRVDPQYTFDAVTRARAFSGGAI